MTPSALRTLLLASIGVSACGPRRLSEIAASEGADTQATTVCLHSRSTDVLTVDCVAVKAVPASAGSCDEDSDCAEREFCGGDPAGERRCVSNADPKPCRTALDCGAGLACVTEAAGVNGTCMKSGCGTCGPDQVCAPFMTAYVDADVPPLGKPPEGAVTPANALACFPRTNDAHLMPGPARSRCDMDGSTTPCAVVAGKWVCTQAVSRHVCGRPVVLEGRPRFAQPVYRAARDVGARHADRTDVVWAERLETIAFEEHASIAAFARTMLQLMALGAPAHLLEATSRALRDELGHARDAFALAALLSPPGRAPTKPGAFAEAAAPLDTDAGSLLEDVFRGGIVGESIAALEASEREHTAPPVAKPFFRRVVEEETRHAELAMATALWLLEAHPALSSRLEGVATKMQGTLDSHVWSELVEPLVDALTRRRDI